MKNNLIFALTGLVAIALIAGCNQKTPPAQQKGAAASPAVAQKAQNNGISGKVVKTMDAGAYTYVQIDTGKKKVWAATPKTALKVGEAIVIPEGLAMKNYHSKTLNRTFDLVYFANGILQGGSGQALASQQPPQEHPRIDAEKAAKNMDFSGLKKAKGGMTVGQIFADKAELAGKQVVVRAKVVKYTPQVMGKNWLHIEDGTGKAGAKDLTVTTTTSAKVGDTVLVSGPITLDKDFGYGYKYAVIMQGAKVKVE